MLLSIESKVNGSRESTLLTPHFNDFKQNSMKYYRQLVLENILIIFLLTALGCSDIQNQQSNSSGINLVTIKNTKTNSTVYQINSEVKISFELTNTSNDKIDLKSAQIILENLENPNAPLISTFALMNDTTLDANENIKIENESIYRISGVVKNFPYGVFLQIENKRGATRKLYLTFFRVVSNNEDLTYDIERSDYDGLPVFTLQGGLSAEYTVQKSIASLAGGISHSWNVPSPGMGPAPIPSTPDFLERSVQKTVDLYDEQFGADTEFETVIISTGIPSGAYIGHCMKAPVLPIHYLVGAHTTKEVRTMLDYNESTGMKSYATMGHDYSLSTSQSVVWVKLLSLPLAYRQFMIDHKVKQVVFFGALGRGGESGARKLRDTNGQYESGSIYLMHFAGDKSEKYLGETIHDFDTAKLEPFDYISDWEAGVVEAQIDSIGAQIRNETTVNSVSLVTTDDAIHLWNMGTYLMLDLLKKNNLEFKGFSMNPYLIGHPVFETFKGYVPFLYWQGIDPQYHIDSRLKTVMADAVKHYYPEEKLNELTYWVNSTNNFGGASQGFTMAESLKTNNYKQIINNNYNESEVWNLDNGINSSSEIRAKEMIASDGWQSIKSWNQNLQFLSLQDIEELSQQFPDIKFIVK